MLFEDSFSRKRHGFVQCGSYQIPSKPCLHSTEGLNIVFRVSLSESHTNTYVHNNAGLNQVVSEPSLSKYQEILRIKQSYIVYLKLTGYMCEM